MIENYIKRTMTKYGYFEYFNSDIFIGKSLKEYGEYSDIELNVMLNFIKPSDVVFDIITNMLYHTFARRVGLSGKVYCFEPQESVFKLLENNVNMNNLKILKYLEMVWELKIRKLNLRT